MLTYRKSRVFVFAVIVAIGWLLGSFCGPLSSNAFASTESRHFIAGNNAINPSIVSGPDINIVSGSDITVVSGPDISVVSGPDISIMSESAMSSCKKPTFTPKAIVSGSTINIQIKDGKDVAMVIVESVGGEKIGEMIGENKSWSLDISDLPNGNYEYHIIAYSVDEMIQAASTTKTIKAKVVDSDIKPSYPVPEYTVSVVTSGPDINFWISDGVNIVRVEVFDVNGNWIGSMDGSGKNWSYTAKGLAIGVYSYRIVACSLPRVEGQKTPEVAITRKTVTASVTQSIRVYSTIYGTSGLGRPLEVVCIEPAVFTEKVFANFAIHGFEDEYAHDGQVLVDCAQAVIDYFTTNPDKLNGWALYVVPCANPDGLIDGWTNNGPGRCQVSLGVDMNRDFGGPSYGNGRNYTPGPFTAPESKALADCVKGIMPNIVYDFHGWLSTTYGSYSAATPFMNSMGIGYSGDTCSGYFADWASYEVGADSALIELSSPYSEWNKQNVINGFLNLFSGK